MQEFYACKTPLFGVLPKLRMLNRERIRYSVRVMKITAFILLVLCLQVSAKTGAQERITLKEKNASLAKILNQIQKQTGISFIFSDETIKESKPINIEVKDAPLIQVLDICFKDQPFAYYFTRNSITVFPKKNDDTNINNLKTNIKRFISVKGRVINEKGEPVIATVKIKGTNTSLTTNENGEFQIAGIDGNSVLIISGVGIESLEVGLEGRSFINISVKISITPLDEIQMIAYGTTTKRFSTGNVSTIKSQEIETQPVTNPLVALQGRVPGIFISQTSGVPGAGINVQIRGQNSISNGNNPLYVVDGVPYSSDVLPNLGTNILQQSNGNAGGGNPLNYINKADIESISLLKDADATSIYGSRGANGVVLITTKKGKAGGMSVNFNVSTGVGQVAHKLDFMNTEQYLTMRREALKNDGATATVFNAKDLLLWDTTRYTDWQKELIGRTAHYTNAQASISGGTIYNQYLISANYHRETAVFPGSYADQRGAMHINLNNTSVNQKFKAGLSINYLVDDNKLPNTDLFTSIILPPNAPEVYNTDGSLNWANSTWLNPLSYSKRKFNSLTNNLISNLNLNYQLLKGLSIKSSFGYSQLQTNELSTVPIAALNPAFAPTGSASFTNNRIRSWIIEPQLNYQRVIGKGNLDFLVGATFQQNKSEGQIIDGTGYTSDLLLENIQAAPQTVISSFTSTLYKYNALFGRVGYNWNSRYLINITGRRDGSSRFGDANKFHSFGSVGAAWVFSNEHFIEKILPFLSYGKFRGSYGTTGNDQIGDYGFYDLYGPNSFQPYQGTVGLNPISLYNPSLQWEETKKWEVAMDLGFLKDKIALNVSYYNNRSSNQLLAYSLSTVSGFSSYTDNLPATVQNSGWELVLNTSNIGSKSFTWKSSINITIPSNKLVSYPNLDNSPYSTRLVIGKSVNIRVKAFQFAGVNDTTGVYQFASSKGGLTYNPVYGTDNNVLIVTDPKYYGGFSNSLNYKGFQLDFHFQFVKQLGGNSMFQAFQPPGGFGTNRTKEEFNRWQQPGDKVPFQKYTQSFFSGAATAYRSYVKLSDYAYTDAFFIRLKNVSISYQIRANAIKKLHINNCRIYASGQNLWTITKYKGIDPETSLYPSTPPLRILMIGIDVTL